MCAPFWPDVIDVPRNSGAIVAESGSLESALMLAAQLAWASPLMTIRFATGSGVATCVATRPEPEAMARIVQQAAAAAGARAVLPGLPAGVEAVRRGDYLFVLNQTGRPVEFAAPAGSVALAGGERLGTDDVAVLGLKSAP